MTFHLLDQAHGSALGAWVAMGRPAFPSREQQEELIRAGQMPAPQPLTLTGGRLTLTLPPHSLALLEIPAAR